jgi:hypothetical protein
MRAPYVVHSVGVAFAWIAKYTRVTPTLIAFIINFGHKKCKDFLCCGIVIAPINKGPLHYQTYRIYTYIYALSLQDFAWWRNEWQQIAGAGRAFFDPPTSRLRRLSGCPVPETPR